MKFKYNVLRLFFPYIKEHLNWLVEIAIDRDGEFLEKSLIEQREIIDKIADE